MSDKSKWFPASVSPVHVGWYECRYAWEGPDYHDLSRHWWDGNRWEYSPADDIGFVWGDPLFDDDYPKEFWRGLAMEQSQ